MLNSSSNSQQFVIPDVFVRRSSGDGSLNSQDEFDLYRCSMVVNDVPDDLKGMLEMAMEIKKRGGGKIVDRIYYPKEQKILFVFEDPSSEIHYFL